MLYAYIDENLEQSSIRPSSSPVEASILFSKKKVGDLRLYVDYRGLNRIIMKGRYPLSLTSEVLDCLVGAKVYTKFDVQNAYHKIRIAKGDERKMAFCTWYGHFKY